MPSTLSKTCAIGALAIAALSLAGCTQFSDLAHNQSTTHADTRADLKSPPAWMPLDAVNIESVTGTAGTGEDHPPTTVVFTSKSGVSSDECRTVTRNSAPVFNIDGAPEAYEAKTVLRCGGWSMTSDADRWVAWTPNDEDTAGARTTPTPTSSHPSALPADGES